MRMRILDNHVLKMEESFSEEEPTTSTSTSTPTTSDDVESSNNLVKKPHTVSLAWKYFSVKANDKGVPIESELDGPICNLCHKRVLAKRSNTTNLFNHLQEHHPKEYVLVNPNVSSRQSKAKVGVDQPSITACIDRTKPYDCNSKRSTQINQAVAVYIAQDMQPFYLVERKGFRQMLHVLDPRYNLPSRRHFTDIEIPRLFSKIKNEVLCTLKKSKYYAGTTDLWTSTANHPYLSFTIHFIDNDWKLQSFCLDTVPLFDDHTGQNIANTVIDVLSNWELKDENLVATTTDNGSNYVAAFKNVLKWPRISCFGHNLDLAINKSLAISHIQKAVKRCHSLVELFNRSWKKNRVLLQKQIELKLPQHKLLAVSHTHSHVPTCILLTYTCTLVIIGILLFTICYYLNRM